MNRMFKTDMERLTTFQNIRSEGILPKEVYDRYPDYVNVLTAMLDEHPEKRPSAHDLLTLPIFSNQSKRDLLNTISEKERRVLNIV